MPRVSCAIEDQVTSSQFTFEEGVGEIVNAVSAIEQIQDYDPKCGIRVSVQRLIPGTMLPTEDEPVDEFLSWGPITKFHPSNAGSNDDPDPQDLGDEVGTEGNCILSISGGKIDRKAKASVFAASLQQHGVQPRLLNGYAPNLIGLQAYFAQQLMPKGEGFTGKKDPTCLVVKDKIYRFPAAQKGSSAKTAAGAAKPATAQKVNGSPAPTDAEAAAAGVAEPDNEVEATAVAMLAKLHEKGDGKPIPRTKIGPKIIVAMAGKVPSKLHKPVQNLIANEEWFQEKAGEFGWKVEGGSVTIPAAG